MQHFYTVVQLVRQKENAFLEVKKKYLVERLA